MSLAVGRRPRRKRMGADHPVVMDGGFGERSTTRSPIDVSRFVGGLPDRRAALRRLGYRHLPIEAQNARHRGGRARRRHSTQRSSTRASSVFIRIARVSERSKRHDSSGPKLGGDARPLARQATIWHRSGKLVVPPSFLQTSANIRYTRNPNAFCLQNTPGLQHLGNLEVLAHFQVGAHSYAGCG